MQLVEIAGHDHWYYDLAPRINQTAWEFLKGFELPIDPRYDEYKFRPEARKEATEQYNLGIKRQREGDLEGAIAAYSRAIELDRKYADAYNNRGVAFLIQKNYTAALADLTKSIELAPSDAAYNNRAGLYFNQGKTEEAIADFTAAIRIKPSAEGYANRGVSYQKTNRDALALADYEEAIKLDPNFGRAYLLRGLVILKRGEAEAAQKDFDRGFKLNPALHAEFDPMIEQLRPTKKP